MLRTTAIDARLRGGLGLSRTRTSGLDDSVTFSSLRYHRNGQHRVVYNWRLSVSR